MTDQERHQVVSGDDRDDDVISLRPYVDTLRQYRRVIYLAVLGMSVIFIAGVLAMRVYYPTERIDSIQFRLMFEGAALHEYPNKAPFSPAEIVASPIVTEVFNANELKQYGTYESFKNALFIQQSNPALDALAYDYQSRLADTKLSPVDRARIEAEFSQKRAALTDPSFSLSLRRTERFRSLPESLAEKALGDTLATWAAHAERAGAMKYQLPILSSAVLSKSSLDKDDYLIAADLLRAKAVRIIDTLAELEKVPGALTIRTTKDHVTLPEIRSSIEDALRFELEPLLGIIRSEGITKNARLLTLYAQAQVFQLTLERRAAEGRALAMQNSLADYMAQRGSRPVGESKAGAAGGARQGFDGPALIPQVSESFLNRLVELSATTQKSEVEYRQNLTDRIIKENTQVTLLDKELAYYQDLVKSVQGIGSRPAGSGELITLITSRSQTSFATISKGADQLVDIYNELSAQNLNPAARLYVVTGPFARQTRSSVAFRSVQLSFLLLLMVTVIATAAGCLVYDRIWRRRFAA